MAEGKKPGAYLAERRERLDKYGRGEMARLARFYRSGTPKSSGIQRFRGRHQKGRFHGRSVDGHGRLIALPGSAFDNLQQIEFSRSRLDRAGANQGNRSETKSRKNALYRRVEIRRDARTEHFQAVFL